MFVFYKVTVAILLAVNAGENTPGKNIVSKNSNPEANRESDFGKNGAGIRAQVWFD